MKNIVRYAYIALIGAMAFTASSCSDSYEYEGRGAADDASKAGAYFQGVGADVASLEVEPGNESFTVTVARTNPGGASTVTLEKEDPDGVFDVPNSVTFASGATTAEVTISPNSNAKPGVSYSLTVKIADADRSNYVDGAQAYVIDYSILKWEDLGICYWVDGLVGTFFGVDNTLAYCTHAYKTTTVDGDRYRFDMPYSHVSTDDDGVGYWGYVYNGEGDCDEQDYKAIVDITPKGAVLRTMDLGFDWGYGMFSVASRSYGEVTDDAISFPAGSLDITMADYGTRATSLPCYLFFSADAYLAWLEAGAE